MPWLLIKLPAAPADVDIISEALESSGALAVTVQAQSDEERFQSALETTPLWNENQVVGLFAEGTDPNAVLSNLRDVTGRVLKHQVSELPDADWGRAWMSQYRPIQISPRLWICPTWREPPDPRAINLLLDPGLAFGTGTHPTTALCLRWLTEQQLTDARVIDYGCGSGILAIAALKLGAKEALGTDVDAQALTVSRENAARNGVVERLRTCLPGELRDDDSGDVVVANILAEPLIALAPELTRRVQPGGLLALSGLLTTQADEVKSHYAAHFALEQQERDGWALLAGRRLN